jgi:hypothetical protein
MGNIIFLFAIVPLSYYGAKNFGAIGAGYVWVFFNLSYFMLWTPLVHRRFIKGSHVEWLIDIFKILVWSFLFAYLLANFFKISVSRLTGLFEIIAIYFLIMVGCIMSIKSTRNNFLFLIKKRNKSI